MGLDVYLYRYDCDIDEGLAKEKAFEQQTEHLWGNEVTKETRTAKMNEIAGTIGLLTEGEYGWQCPKEAIRIDSAKYPEHYFKIGYLRSSYNEGGINRVLEVRGLPTLYGVFQPADNYIVRPDWSACKERIQDLRMAYGGAMLGPEGQYEVTFEGPNVFVKADTLPASAKDALQLFIAELETQKQWKAEEPRPYSNPRGFFTQVPMEVVAVLPGKGVLGNHGCYLVYKKPNSGEEPDWYAQALEITEEMIDWVLAQPNQQQYVLHWSA